MSLVDILSGDSPLLWKTYKVIFEGREVVGEVCKVYDDKAWLCNKDVWIEVYQKDLLEVEDA